MFSTGEFSRIARVSRRLLQFYDEEGLLRPFFVDPQTGYRRYGAQQLPSLNRILALKELGLSLTEIRRLLDDGISEVEVHRLLKIKQVQVQKEMDQNLQRLRQLEARLLFGAEAPDVVLKSLPAEQGLNRTAFLHSGAEIWPWVQETARLLLNAAGSRRIAHFYARVPGEGFETHDLLIEAGCSVVADAEIAVEGFTKFVNEPAKIVATVAQTGGPEALHTGCAAIGRFIQAQGFQLASPPREVFVTFPLPMTCADTVIESQFPLV